MEYLGQGQVPEIPPLPPWHPRSEWVLVLGEKDPQSCSDPAGSTGDRQERTEGGPGSSGLGQDLGSLGGMMSLLDEI